jgi:DNA-binding transcriptional LysR family regulator
MTAVAAVFRMTSSAVSQQLATLQREAGVALLERVGRRVRDGLISQQLMEEHVLLALPEKWRGERDPIGLKRLARENWIVGSRQADDRQLVERACAVAGFEPRITHTVNDYDLELRMISAGLGVGFVPELGLQFSRTEAVEVRTASGPPLSRHVHALTRSALAGSPMVRAVLSELLSAG